MDLHEALNLITVGAALVAAIIGHLNRGAIKEVHLTMNSRLDALLLSTKASAFAEGRAAHIADEASAAAKVLSDAANQAATVLETAAKKAE